MIYWYNTLPFFEIKIVRVPDEGEIEFVFNNINSYSNVPDPGIVSF